VSSEPSAETSTRLGPEDLDPCLQLDRVSFGGWWTRQQWLEELTHPHAIGIGIDRGGDLLAMAWGRMIIEELHVSLVAVAPSQRRRGLGRLALEQLLRVSREEGVRAATLEVGSRNGAARALYAAAGFQTVGVRSGYYRNGDDAFIQWLHMN
jgi:ribosomal-protein-alanine N-acetyltransferase